MVCPVFGMLKRRGAAAVNVTLNAPQPMSVTNTARGAVFVHLARRRRLSATFTAGSAARPSLSCFSGTGVADPPTALGRG
jgi:hypothetical protein